MLQIPLQFDLDSAATLDNFFVGANAQLCSRLRQVVSQGNELLFIFGEFSTGKSHLAHAACHLAFESDINASFIPMKEPALDREMLKGLEQFQLVVIDDLDFRFGDPQWETAIFDLYNRCKDSGASLIFFSAQPVASAEIKLADLRSRLGAMEIYQIKPVADNELKHFLQWRGRRFGLEISDELANFLLSRVSRTGAALVDLLKKLDRVSLAQQRKLTIPFVKQVLGL